jgi:hypothetical protein
LPEPKPSLVDTILNVVTALKPFWKFLRMQNEFDPSDPEKSGAEFHWPIIEFRGDEVEKDNQVRPLSMPLGNSATRLGEILLFGKNIPKYLC